MQSSEKTDKSLGQHWLKDQEILREIISYANLSANETVLEIGPGLGTLTAEILAKNVKVTAVEFDENLAENLRWNVVKNLQAIAEKRRGEVDGYLLLCEVESPAFRDLEIINADFLQFDLNLLPENYKVIANIPYNITAKIVQKLLYDENSPQISVLLMQKEVAERLAARAGEMSVLAVSAQLRAEISLGIIVPPEKFTPPPKVDSQVVILKLREKPLFADLDEKIFFRVVKAGFSARRKKLRTSLAGGLNLSKIEAENLLEKSDTDFNLRAQDLSLENWYNLSQNFREFSK